MTEFAHVIAAVEAREHNLEAAEGRLWAIGTAIIKDCFPATTQVVAGKPGVRNGSKDRIEQCAQTLKKRGHGEYDASTLRDYAAVVRAFPPNRRHKELSFTHHRFAKSPDILDWIIKQEGKKVKVTEIARLIKRWRALSTTKHVEKLTKAKAKKAKAATPEQKQEAQAEIDAIGDMPTPRAKLAPPSKQEQAELAVVADILDVDGDAIDILKTLRANLARLNKLPEIAADYADSLISKHEEIGEVAQQIVSRVRGTRFKVIDGGKEKSA